MAKVLENPTYRDVAFQSAESGGPGWLSARRQAAFVRFQTVGFPTRKQEDWRFVSLDAALEQSYERPVNEAPDPAALKKIEQCFLGEDGHTRLVFVNGHFFKKFSLTEGLPPGAVFGDLHKLLQREPQRLEPYLARPEAERNAFAAANTLHFTDGAALFLPRSMRCEKPLHILFVNTGGQPAPVVQYPRVTLVLDEGASAHVLVNHVALTPEPYLVNAVVEAHLSAGSRLDYVDAQRSGREGSHLASLRFLLEKESRLNATFFTEGGSLTRNEVSVDFLGERAEADVQGLAVLDGASAAHQAICAHHAAPYCKSRQFFKNILGGSARGEFNSLVRVAKGAMKSDSGQLSRNLLLSETAHGVSRPRLLIETDDVICAHGSTTGQLEKDELFYLRSRGLSKDLARYILVYGFAEEILEGITDGSLRKELEKLTEEKLTAMTRTVL